MRLQWRGMNLSKCAPRLRLGFGFSAAPEEECGPSIRKQGGSRIRKPILAYCVDALKACSSCKDIETGKKIHFDAIENDLHLNIFVASALISMYAKCGSLEDARRVFNRMAHRDVVSWTALIVGYVTNGENEAALQLFWQMKAEGCAPDGRTLVAALMACSSLAVEAAKCEEMVDGKQQLVKLQCLAIGMQVHSQADAACCQGDIFVGSALVDMYAKCGSLLDARMAFDRMVRHDVVCWSSLILAYVDNGDHDMALELFESMEAEEGCAPNSRTFVAALMACAGLADKEQAECVDGRMVKMASLENGRRIHGKAAKCGFESEMFVGCTLVDMYARCGSMGEARSVFDRMPCYSVVVWNCMMVGLVENGESEAALDLFLGDIRSLGFRPDVRTFVAALRACATLLAQAASASHSTSCSYSNSKDKDKLLVWLEKGMAIHREAAAAGAGAVADVYVASTLVDMYANSGSMLDARLVFDRMPFHNVVAWTALILGYTNNGEPELALALFERMRSYRIQPNFPAYVAALKACVCLAAAEAGQEIDGQLVKLASLEKGISIHSQLRDLTSCSSSSSSNCDYLSDMFVANTLIDMYAKCGKVEEAHRVFDAMPSHSLVSWHALMLGYTDNGNPDVALQLFAQMTNKNDAAAVPISLTYVAALMACAATVNLDTGRAIHVQVCRHGHESDADVATCLVDLYGKCGGSVVTAHHLFDSFFNSSTCVAAAAWNALIAGYSRQGGAQVGQMFELFQRMKQEGVQPDVVTFLSVLAACSHAGLVDRAKSCFASMCNNRNVAPSILHYTCMIDLFGRLNRLPEAVEMVNKMPFKPDAVTWTSILAACQKWKNVAVGKMAFDTLVTLDDSQATPYVLMANIMVPEQNGANRVSKTKLDA